jgi:type II secretory pathway predicted ATPase ExeA
MSSLYLKRFNLERKPFAIVPDSAFFFTGEQRGAVFESLHHAVLHEAGMLVVVGEVGTGKTMLCRMLSQRLRQQGFDVAFLPDSSLGRESLMAAVAADLGITYSTEASGVDAATLALQKALMARAATGRRLTILADEAHTMQPAALDALRMLSNIETEQHKLVQIVLFGQTELKALLQRPGLRQVRDRVAEYFHLQPLSNSGARAYLEHRLRCAGWQGDMILKPAAVRAIARGSRGCLRALSILADKAMLAAYGEGARCVEAVHVHRALQNLAPPTAWARWLGLSAPQAALSRWLLPALLLGAAGLVGRTAIGDALRGPPDQLLAKAGDANPRLAADPAALLAAAPTAAGTAAAEGRYYTLQLASLADEQAAVLEKQRIADLFRDGAPAALFVARSKGGQAPVPWVVRLGHFATRAAAVQAQAALPDALQANRPRVLAISA